MIETKCVGLGKLIYIDSDMISVQEIAKNFNLPERVFRDIFSFPTHKRYVGVCPLPDLSDQLCITDDMYEVSGKTVKKIKELLYNLTDYDKSLINNAIILFNSNDQIHARKDLKKYENNFHKFFGRISAINNSNQYSTRINICIDYIRDYITGSSITFNKKNEHIWIFISNFYKDKIKVGDFIIFNGKSYLYNDKHNKDFLKYGLKQIGDIQILTLQEAKKWWKNIKDTKVSIHYRKKRK